MGQIALPAPSEPPQPTVAASACLQTDHAGVDVDFVRPAPYCRASLSVYCLPTPSDLGLGVVGRVSNTSQLSLDSY